MEYDVHLVFEVEKSYGGIVVQCIPAVCIHVQGCRWLCLNLSSLSSRLSDFEWILKNLMLNALNLTLVVHIRLNAILILSTYRDLDSNILNASVNWLLLLFDS